MLIPVQKKFEKQRTYSSSSKMGKMKISSVFRFVPLKFVWIFFIVFALFYGVFLGLKYTLFSPEYTIKKVDYSLSSVKQYDNPYLYKKISTLIKGENYYVVSWKVADILESLQAEFPFVADIMIVYTSANKVFVKVLYEEPQMVMRNDGRKFGVYDGEVFQIYSGNQLGSGTIGMDVLSFSSGLQMLTGVFYQKSADRLLQDLMLLKEGFPTIQSFTYIPGGQRIIVHLPEERKIYINAMVDIPKQIKNYQLLKKFYPEVNKLKEIDLGSLESDKIIVKK